jgi:ADP-ribosylglycohydrolase
MLGAIAGDVIGSVYEANPVKHPDFPLFPPGARFTDDTVLTMATADALMGDGDYAAAYRRFGRAFPHAGYGGTFYRWLFTDGAGPYGSWGNGAAMRVSPVGFALGDVESVLEEAARSAAVTHDHPEGIKGAQATALAVFLARQGLDRDSLRDEIQGRFGYDLGRSIAAIRPHYHFDVSCQGSVPESLIAFLESRDFEGAVRNAVSLGGDADTMACIAGAVAEAFYGGVPAAIAAETRLRLPKRFLQVLGRFEALVKGRPLLARSWPQVE